jgi:hypothetical protein
MGPLMVRSGEGMTVRISNLALGICTETCPPPYHVKYSHCPSKNVANLFKNNSQQLAGPKKDKKSTTHATLPLAVFRCGIITILYNVIMDKIKLEYWKRFFRFPCDTIHFYYCVIMMTLKMIVHNT